MVCSDTHGYRILLESVQLFKCYCDNKSLYGRNTWTQTHGQTYGLSLSFSLCEGITRNGPLAAKKDLTTFAISVVPDQPCAYAQSDQGLRCSPFCCQAALLPSEKMIIYYNPTVWDWRSVRCCNCAHVVRSFYAAGGPNVVYRHTIVAGE